MSEPTPLRLAIGDALVRRGVDPAAAVGDLPEPDHDLYTRQEILREAGEYADKHIPARYADAIADHPDVVDWLHRLLDLAITNSVMNAQCAVKAGPSLLILGLTGVGKTHQAFGAIRLLSQSGVRCAWKAIAAADLYAKLRPRHGVDSEKEFRALADAPLLLVDDLGAAKTSEWVEEVNYRLVNWRYERILPTLFTSNVRPKELGASLGERVASRLIEMAERVVLQGSDRRRAGSDR
ncbi:ATP-binding protein [Nonomuraea sp. NPDC050790]|uniref:ATP-binding protein n=1 Tax=Nonomuraea sp. NPDC050790 TaxID=3364371 RepID=UPI0037B9B13D